MYRHLTVVILSMLCTYNSSAQNIVRVLFRSTWGNSPLPLDSSVYATKDTSNVAITNLKYYVSGITLLHNSHLVYSEPNSVHLIDARMPSSSKVLLHIPKDVFYNRISFNLGIDSTTNVSGAMGGDLDPTKGMYWTWQSGYINFKLEGKSNACKTRNNEFHYHLGGYSYPFSSMQPIVLNIASTDSIVIEADVAAFINQYDLGTQNSVMIPGLTAVSMSRQAAAIFSVRK